MSKRAGEFVTLREVVEEVGRDAVRFDMLYRKNDAALDFDLAKVIEASRDNPVFYVQYGHARGQSVFRNARAEMPDLPADDAARTEWLKAAPLEVLSDPGELSLLRKIALYPRTVEAAATAHEPHRIAFYPTNWQANFTHNGRVEKTCLIYASLSRMIHKRPRRGWPWSKASLVCSPRGWRCSGSKRQKRCDRSRLPGVLLAPVAAGETGASTNNRKPYG